MYKINDDCLTTCLPSLHGEICRIVGIKARQISDKAYHPYDHYYEIVPRNNPDPRLKLIVGEHAIYPPFCDGIIIVEDMPVWIVVEIDTECCVAIPWTTGMSVSAANRLDALALLQTQQPWYWNETRRKESIRKINLGYSHDGTNTDRG
jgi:hypothetical protein